MGFFASYNSKNVINGAMNGMELDDLKVSKIKDTR
jgi:hypothetical protein